MPTAPAQMAAAQSQDAPTRAQLEALYARCLRTYRTSIRPQDTELDDAGAAVALFVAVNLHALHDIEATPSMLDVLERQLRGVTRRSAEWDVASRAQRQCFFERIAILAVLMAGNHGHAKSQGADRPGRGALHRTPVPGAAARLQGRPLDPRARRTGDARRPRRSISVREAAPWKSNASQPPARPSRRWPPGPPQSRR